jgi:hypothetical protein
MQGSLPDVNGRRSTEISAHGFVHSFKYSLHGTTGCLLKPSLWADEPKIHCSCRTIPMLRNIELEINWSANGHLVILVRFMKEYHKIGILLNRAAFSKI